MSAGSHTSVHLRVRLSLSGWTGVYQPLTFPLKLFTYDELTPLLRSCQRSGVRAMFKNWRTGREDV
eukprot:5671-Eustigmatos_ZCMA.PRE.1